MTDKRSNPQKSSSLLEELTQLTKMALYRVAQVLGIPQRSLMNKSELVEALSQKQDEAHTVIKKLHPAQSTSNNVEALNAIPSAVPASSRPARKVVSAPAQPAGQIPPVKEKPAGPETVTSAMPEPAPKPELKEPDSVWAGEEGPDLPIGYGVTILRALPRDPFWAYVYWELSEQTRDAIRSEKGEWFFDIAEPLIRVLDGKGNTVNEVPVLLDANCWYLNLKPNGTFEFELGLKDQDGIFYSIARSNRLTLPPMEPSQVTDEKWAVISEEFEEVLYQAAGVDLTTKGGSGFPSMVPHILRHRKRVPWIWTNQQWPSSHQWVSSHSMPSSHTMPSSHVSVKK